MSGETVSLDISVENVRRMMFMRGDKENHNDFLKRLLDNWEQKVRVFLLLFLCLILSLKFSLKINLLLASSIMRA